MKSILIIVTLFIIVLPAMSDSIYDWYNENNAIHFTGVYAGTHLLDSGFLFIPELSDEEAFVWCQGIGLLVEVTQQMLWSNGNHYLGDKLNLEDFTINLSAGVLYFAVKNRWDKKLWNLIIN